MASLKRKESMLYLTRGKTKIGKRTEQLESGILMIYMYMYVDTLNMCFNSKTYGSPVCFIITVQLYLLFPKVNKIRFLFTCTIPRKSWGDFQLIHVLDVVFWDDCTCRSSNSQKWYRSKYANLHSKCSHTKSFGCTQIGSRAKNFDKIPPSLALSVFLFSLGNSCCRGHRYMYMYARCSTIKRFPLLIFPTEWKLSVKKYISFKYFPYTACCFK